MEVNTLVKHTKLSTLGIGCISKVLKTKVKVNFGTDDVLTINPNLLSIVDVSKCKTIEFRDFQKQTVCNTVKHETVIIGNEIKHYVGIGWVSHGVVTEKDLTKYPRII